MGNDKHYTPLVLHIDNRMMKDAGNSLSYDGLAIDFSSSSGGHPVRRIVHIGSDILRKNEASAMIRDDILVKVSSTSNNGHFFPLLPHIGSEFT